MVKILITGATGNVGMEVINSLQKIDHSLDLYAGVRDIKADKTRFVNYNIKLVQFDFTNSRTYNNTINDCDILFLIRPPQISEVEKYFKPLIESCIETGVKHIVFLSVQGVEKSKIIPHYKIEKLIVNSKIAYTFLRPAYFMQNFATTLRNDLVNNKQIYLPAGQAKFTLIDIRDIGAVAANILTDISSHLNASYDLTSNEKLTFHEMAEIMSRNLESEIQYISPSLIGFFLKKRKEGLPNTLIFVMIMLHYFPRFQNEPNISGWVEKIIKRQPISFEQFIIDNKRALTAWK